MATVYNEETGAESVFVYNEDVYKVDEANSILPGMYNELRFEANRDLTNVEIDILHGLVRYHWVHTVDGLPLDDMFCDGYNAYSVSASLFNTLHTEAQALLLGRRFVATLNDFIATGSPKFQDGTQELAPMEDITVTVWASEVVKKTA
jgi:hypothetical protein